MVMDMSKRRISKASKRRLSFLGPLCLIAIFYSAFLLLYNAYTIYELSMEKENLENKLVKLQEESENLKTDIEKLNDDEYLANYAREHYLYSKDGEYIIHIEDSLEDSIDNIETNINKNYILIGASLFVIILLYIIKRGKKK